MSPRLGSAVLLLLLPTAVLPTAVRAEKPTPAAGAAADSTTPGTFLWKITGKQGETAHLLGSIHMGDDSLYPLADVIEKAFAQSEVVAVEADIGKQTAEIQLLLVQAAMLTDGTTLADHLPKKLYERLAKEGRRNGLDISQLGMFKPWFVAMTMLATSLQRAGIRPDQGIERHFLRKARGTQQIVELEGVAYQLDLFNSFDEKQARAFITYALEDAESITKDTRKLMAAWKRGDTSVIEKLNEEMRADEDLKPLYEVFFARRNREMTLKIDGYLKSGKRHFVIVGAAHTVGPDGIVKLLEKRGYRAERF